MIRFRAVGKRFGAAAPPALVGIDLEVADGSVVGLVGRNGAGKTTLLRLAAGLLHPTEGGIEVDGRPLDLRRGPGRPSLGWVPEAPTFEEGSRARSLLEHLGRLDGLDRRSARGRAEESLERWGLTGLADRSARSLSLGERKRLALAISELAGPGNVLQDEVTNGLDPAGRRRWEASLRELRQRGGCALLASHRWEEIEAWSDRVVVLDRGRLVASVPGRELTERPRWFRLWLDGPTDQRLEELRALGHVSVGGGGVELVGTAAAGVDPVAAVVRIGFRVRRSESFPAELAPYLVEEAG